MEAKIIKKILLGFYLITSGIIIFVIGLFVQNYHQFSHTSEGYFSGIIYPYYPFGILLIVISVILITFGFYLIVKEKITS